MSPITGEDALRSSQTASRLERSEHATPPPRLRRIYPVAVKPRTRINRWRDWPEDCVETIKRMVSGWYPTRGVFKCDDCNAYCEPHPYGVPHIGREHPTIVCDDCLIERARAA